MATRSGFPAISTPRALELRAVQQSIDNIRERFRGVETLLDQTAAIVGASTTGQTLQALQSQINNLLVSVNALVVQVEGLSALDDRDMPVYALVGRLASLEREVSQLAQAPPWSP
jgi:hypothetical protein